MEALEQAEEFLGQAKEFLGPVGVAGQGLGVLQFVVGVPRWRPMTILGRREKRGKTDKAKEARNGR